MPTRGKRFDPILEQYLIIFREQLQQVIKSEHMPPYYSAKAQAESFGAELAKLKHQMYAEMSAGPAHWLQEYPADVKGDCERVTHAWIDRLCENSANDTLSLSLTTTSPSARGR